MKRCRRICWGLRCELGHRGKHVAHVSKQSRAKFHGFEKIQWTPKKREGR